MSADTLIVLAGGGSRAHIVELIAAHPDARIWTLNAMRHERAELQFEIHAPAPIAALDPDQPAIVSPFFAGDPPARWRRFPLAAAIDLGAAFFELSHDYMLAFAALLQRQVLPRGALPAGVSSYPISCVYLCGVDANDSSHYGQSRGIHFWAGLLRGLGVEVVAMPESTVLAQAGLLGEAPGRPQRPYFYGQPKIYGGNC